MTVQSHKDFSFTVDFPKSVESYRGRPLLIQRVRIDELYARIVRDVSRNGVRHQLTKLEDTPHYQFVMGRREPYRAYLAQFGADVGAGIEHSEASFEQLVSSELSYLAAPHASSYILCERVKSLLSSKLVVLDGVHRACILRARGLRELPVAVLQDRPLEPGAQLDRYLRDYKDDFREWYTPIQVGGRTIHERTYPRFVERPEYLTNRERGQSKWDFAIGPHLPDVRGKSVCDIGCNVGLYCINLSQRGARAVTGFDRAEQVVQPTNPELPRQNVVNQAYFVRNLFRLAGEHAAENVSYRECDLSELDFSALRYDMLFSTCVLYHFGRARFEAIIRDIAPNIPEVFLQTNLGHTQGELGELVRPEYQANVLRAHGYVVKIVEPPNYAYPLIIGRK